jgi:hypothetical protein
MIGVAHLFAGNRITNRQSYAPVQDITKCFALVTLLPAFPENFITTRWNIGF